MAIDSPYIKGELNKVGAIATIVGGSDDLEITQSDFNCNGVNFTNCSFGSLTIKGVNLKAGLRFHRTKVKWLTITDCTNEILESNFGIFFDNCEIEFLHITKSKSESLHIAECKSFGSISLSNNAFREISITHSTINLDVYIKENKVESEIDFYDSVFNETIHFDHNIYSKLSFVKATFNNDIKLKKEKAEKSIELSRCTISGVFEANLELNGPLQISEIDFKKSCEVLFSHKGTSWFGDMLALSPQARDYSLLFGFT